MEALTKAFTNKMKKFQNVMSGIENLYVWQYILIHNEQLALFSSNCPDEAFWHNIFMFSFHDKLLELCKDSDSSIWIGDDIGVLWIATPQYVEGRLQRLWLLGPAFTSDIHTLSINKLLAKRELSIAYKRELIRQLERLPIISHSVLCVLGTLQHYCATNSRIHMTDIRTQDLHNTSANSETSAEKESPHSSAEQEALMLKAIQEGNIQYRNQISEYLNVISKNPVSENILRQFKDETIVEITLSSRAAVKGGLSREMALTMSDLYIQEVENAQTLLEVSKVHLRMCKDYIQQVHNLKLGKGFSPAVIACMDYVTTHITDNLSVASVAANTGYAGYYVSRLFQKETKQSLSDYIQKKKIDYAAFLLKQTEQSTSDIARTLHFSSPSHFCTVFRKEMGMTPTQYKMQG